MDSISPIRPAIFCLYEVRSVVMTRSHDCFSPFALAKACWFDAHHNTCAELAEVFCCLIVVHCLGLLLLNKLTLLCFSWRDTRLEEVSGCREESS